MNPKLERLRDELQTATRDLTAASLDHSPEGKWSAGQILEHLYLSYKGTNTAIAKCMKTGQTLATQPTTKHGIRRFVVLGLGYLPEGGKSPDGIRPRGLPMGEVGAGIFQELGAMDSALDACERRFGTATRIMNHPLLGPLTANQWRKFHLLHGRLHLRQIRERARAGPET